MLYFQLFIKKFFLLKFYSNFLSQWFFISFCMFFVFNLYARRLSYTKDLLCIIFCIIWVESPMGISRGYAVSYFLLPLVFSFYRNYILYYRGILLLPWSISFLSRTFLFCREIFSFVAIIFLLPRKFLFCREIFSFSVTYFLFVTRIFLLPWEFLFCRELFYFTVTLVGHRNTWQGWLLLRSLTAEI